MPYKDPKFLDKYFDAQEEKSLVQIQLIEEIEHNYFELLKNHQTTKESFENRFNKLLSDKEELMELYEGKLKELSSIQKLNSRNELFENDEFLLKDIRKIVRIFDNLRLFVF